MRADHSSDVACGGLGFASLSDDRTQEIRSAGGESCPFLKISSTDTDLLFDGFFNNESILGLLD